MTARPDRSHAPEPPREGARPVARPDAETVRFNGSVASRLEEAGALLHQQGANPYRVRAYERAARVVRSLDVPASEVLRVEGLEGLERLPGIGHTLALAIRDVVRLGYLPMLERLRGDADPVNLLRSVPGIGRTLAVRLHETLGLETLEDLEAAAEDGRLVALKGFGRKRLDAIRTTLAQRLSRVRAPAAGLAPAVTELLDVDREYRQEAAAGRLPTIAPRRFNPSRRRWLPILHTARGGRHYTALFSNTALAHRLARTGDWVVIHADDGALEGQWTVVTATSGPLRGHRVVRGREAECLHLQNPAGVERDEPTGA
ncbi:MAG: helix-hairpin-helix domain-containing protein [Vicinamibacterales bacterium]